MEPQERVGVVGRIMIDFADRTGLTSSVIPPRRYLWTDAFAVCNFLELHRQTGDVMYRDHALRLVDQVHGVLGRHREDDPRSGWLSGMDDEEGELHPTLGGLRIGKALPERQPDEPFDERLEWERDGQYYHYLTKWMVALNRLSRETGEARFNRWAMELARAAQARFAYQPPSSSKRRMYWKMSIDMSRPLVAAMGTHDPLDGLLTCLELQSWATAETESTKENLEEEIRDLAGLSAGRDWTTDDPLGLGGILSDALRAAKLIASGRAELGRLLEELLDAAAEGLSFYASSGALDYAAEYRLAFRELGLSIGLHAAKRLREVAGANPDVFVTEGEKLDDKLQRIFLHRPLLDMIEGFWLRPESQKAASWGEHQDINAVMLATSLLPDGFFGQRK